MTRKMEMRGPLDDLVCCFCGDSALTASGAGIGRHTRPGHIVCDTCGHDHDVVYGVPFIGGYDADDFGRLVEIVGGFEHRESIPAPTVRAIYGAFGQVLATGAKETAFAALDGEVGRGFLDAHFDEWRHFNAMLGGTNLRGSSVLVLDAGAGLDAVRVGDAGGSVVCLEASPLRLQAGLACIPDARWLGGLKQRLPFDDETFDLVCLNASRETPDAGALREVFRVLKVDGRFFLTGLEPAAPREAGVAFDPPEAPPRSDDDPVASNAFGATLDAIRAIPGAALGAIIAEIVEPARFSGISSLGEGFSDYWVPAWDDNVAALREIAARVSFAAVKVAQVPLAMPTLSAFALRPALVASWCEDQVSGLERLMAWAPEDATGAAERRMLAPRGQDGRCIARWLEHVGGPHAPRFEVELPVGAEATLVVNGRAVETLPPGVDGRCAFRLPGDAPDDFALVELRAPAVHGQGLGHAVRIRVGLEA